jgi:hypothetical protein
MPLSIKAVALTFVVDAVPVIGSAVPAGVAAAVTEAGDMTYEDLPGAELVAVGAAGLTRQADHPLPAPDHGTQGNAPVHNGRGRPAWWWDQRGVSWCSSVASHQ